MIYLTKAFVFSTVGDYDVDVTEPFVIEYYVTMPFVLQQPLSTSCILRHYGVCLTIAFVHVIDVSIMSLWRLSFETTNVGV